MKQILFISVFAFLLGCNPEPENHDNRSDSIRIADSLAETDSLLGADSAAKPLEDSMVPEGHLPDGEMPPMEFAVRMRVLFTSSYCGGARPSEEMLAEKADPRPLSSSTIKLKNHFSGYEYYLKTDQDGMIAAEMEQGKYDVFLTEDINSGLPTGFDPKCSLWLNQVLCQVKVSPESNSPDVNIHFICNPCDETMKRRQ